MSHSPTSETEDDSVDGEIASSTLDEMLAGGRSYSGRERNCVFLNTLSHPDSGGRFATISAASGLDFPDDARAIGLFDWNFNGKIDLIMTNRNAPRLRLMVNETPHDNHFVSFQLQGDGITTNRDAIGARVEIYLTDAHRDGPPAKRIKGLRAGEGFLAQSSKYVHFGLGDFAHIDKVRVRWPNAQGDASWEEFDLAEVDRYYRLVQGTGQAEPLELPQRDINMQPGEPDSVTDDLTARIPLQTLLPAPTLDFLDARGRRRTRSLSGDRPVLALLWSKDCSTCLAELREFTERQDELRQAGIDVLALSVNGLLGSGGEAEAERILNQKRFPFERGFVTQSLVDEFQSLHNHLIPLNNPLPVPAGFLIDGRGRLAAIYKGKVSIDDVIRDRDHSIGTSVERYFRSAQIPGRLIGDPWIDDAIVRQAAAVQVLYANELHRQGLTEQAVKQYQEVLKLRPSFIFGQLFVARHHVHRREWNAARQRYQLAMELNPDNAGIHNALSNIHMELGDLTTALSYSARAIELAPETAEFHYNLGHLQQRRRQPQEAIAAFDQALQLNEQYFDAALATAAAHEMLGQWDLAETGYRRAIRIDPRSADAHFGLGSVHVERQEWQQAKEQFEQALRLQPNHQGAQFYLQQALQMIAADQDR